MRDRGERVRHERRVKAKIRRIWKAKIRRIWWVSKPGEPAPTPRWVGHMASTHGKPCSCPFCGNKRRYAGPTVQERRVASELRDRQQEHLYDVPDDPPWMDWEYLGDFGEAQALFKAQDTRPLRVPLVDLARRAA